VNANIEIAKAKTTMTAKKAASFFKAILKK
jgi:hypothetical protein